MNAQDLGPTLGPTLGDTGEFELIAALVGIFEGAGQAAADSDDPTGQTGQVLIGPGDDAALVRIRNGHVVISTDLLVEGRHFRTDWCDAEDVGHRAAAQNLSDINAMGGTAHTLTIGLAAPPTLPVSWALDFARGFAAECDEVGAGVVGGDLTSADQIVIAVTVLGGCMQAPVKRSGAMAGDIVALCGRQGWAAAGLAVLSHGFRSPRAVVEAYRRPEPPYGQGLAAALAGATSMIDVSDGLLADLGHLAAQSGVAIDVRTAGFDMPEAFETVASALGADPMSFILGGGDDHGLVATFPAGTSLPQGWKPIGEVREGSGVTVDNEEYGGPRGWTHF